MLVELVFWEFADSISHSDARGLVVLGCRAGLIFKESHWLEHERIARVETRVGCVGYGSNLEKPKCWVVASQ